MSEAVSRIEVKEVQAGFHSIHVFEADGTHWSSGTLVQSNMLYGPFTPEVSESMRLTHGVLTVVPKDIAQHSFDVRPYDDDPVTLGVGETFYLLARTSASYLCGYADEPEEQAEEPPAEEDVPAVVTPPEAEPEGKPDGATPPAKGTLIVPPRPAPPRTGTTWRTPIGAPGTPDAPDDTEGGEPCPEDKHAGRSHE